MIIYFFNLIIQIVISCSSVINIFLMRPQYLKNWSRLIKTPYLHLLNFNNRKHVRCCCLNHLPLTSDKFWIQWRSLLCGFFFFFLNSIVAYVTVSAPRHLSGCCRVVVPFGGGSSLAGERWGARERGGALGVLATVLLTVDSSLPPSPAGCLRR